ncbi:MAG TPA: hypothetical protein VMS93_08050 [Candidatus Saccharimonadales bacterium]|nr:hypothetical protein [Candidatus Saccharimonadales bacterium]
MRRGPGRGAAPGWLRPALGGLLALGLAAGGAGCAGTRPRLFQAESLAWSHPRVAFLPLENLSNRPDAAETLSHIFHLELVRTGQCEVVEPGEVDAALSDLGIRNTGSLSTENLKGLGQRLKVDYVLLGTVLESGTVRTADADVPCVGVSLRLLEVGTARAVWAAMDFRTGEDHETVFGWGREYDPQRLAAELAAGMFADLARLTRAPAGRKEGAR